MSGFISQETINNVRDVSDIISVIGEYTKLDRKTGNKWWGCCPFHSEKTPSFQVFQQPYHHPHHYQPSGIPLVSHPIV